MCIPYDKFLKVSKSMSILKTFLKNITLAPEGVVNL